MMEDKILLIGCGILKKEIRYLIDRNHWPLESHFLDSTLHIDFEKLSDKLTAALDKHQDRKTMVFYGTCHPLMEGILKRGNTIRTPGQNCVDILLGHELFMAELGKGAFFLLEDWALRFEHVLRITFGDNIELVREIFQGDRKYILSLRTPCSGDFSEQAEEAGELVGMPVRWMDVSLGHMEKVLLDTINRKINEIAGGNK